MATVDPTVAQGVHPGITMVTWVLASGDTATEYEGPDNADKTVHIYGADFGGGTVTITGSNDGTNYVGMSDTSGTAVSVTADALIVLLESPRYIIPVLTGGSAGSVTIILCARKTS